MKSIYRKVIAQADDKELVRKILSLLPKKTRYSKHNIVDGQEQYWFDLTYPFTDWAWKKKVDIAHDHVWEAYFKPYIDKLDKALPGTKSVARGNMIVVVRETK